jgi:hypothetical protein
MKLRLERKFLGSEYTIGKLYIDDVYFCDTLEDKVRDYNKDGDLLDPGEEKIYGETAIPYGLYTIIVNMSPKFKRLLPRLLNVKHFEGILIHGVRKGFVATAKHTHGCILVGKNTVKGGLTESATYTDKLTLMLLAAQDKQDTITIEII